MTIVRMRHHPPTRAYLERRTAEGLSKRESIRCLKRYLARAIYAALPRSTTPPQPAAARQHRSIERFHKAMLDEWAYGRLYRSNHERCRAFTRWLRLYNHRRPRTSLDGLTPMAALVNNLGGNYT